MLYSAEKLEKIAASIGVNVDRVIEFASNLEGAAAEYRCEPNRPTFARGGGLELKPSQIRAKLDQIEKTARRLLMHLGIDSGLAPDDLDHTIARWLSPATDGSLNIDLLATWIAGRPGDGENAIQGAAERMSAIVILIEGAKAAAFIQRQANEAQSDVADIGKMLTQPGPAADPAFERWAARMVGFYTTITGSEPAMSVGGPGRPDEGVADGPLVRFLTACGSPLEIDLSEDAWRSWFRRYDANKLDRPERN